MKIRVSIVEDNRGTRESLQELLQRAPTLDLVGIHPTGEEALGRISAEKPDVMLMDIHLPGMSGIECVARVKKELPNTQVLMLTGYRDNDLIFDSLRNGASGYLLKNLPPGELVQSIEQVHSGGSPMSMEIARRVVSHFQQIKAPRRDIEMLTKREHEVLILLTRGYFYKEIGDQLGISVSCVRFHLHSVYEKMHVQTRTEAVIKYLKPGVTQMFNGSRLKPAVN